MPFPIAAVIGAVAGIGSAVLGSASSQAQANAQYEEAEKQAKKRYERDVAEWELANQVAEIQWWWDKARVEQMRFNERQKAADAEAYQAGLINAAQGQLSSRISEITARSQMEQQTEFARASTEYPYRMQALTIETLEATRQYLNQVNQQALQAGQFTDKVQRETDQLVQSLVLEEQRDKLGWELNKIQSLVEDSKAGARSVDRQGGGRTSKLLMLQAAKQLGRTWGEMEIRATDRKTRLGLMNSTMQGEYAKQLGIYALGMQDTNEKARFAITRSRNEESFLSGTMEKLTIPGFALRETVYGTQRQAAIADFNSTAASVNRPYRQEEYFDPLKPIPGLKPEYIGPTQPSGGNAVFTIGNAILGGVQGAMNFSYKGNDGKLNFY